MVYWILGATVDRTMPAPRDTAHTRHAGETTAEERATHRAQASEAPATGAKPWRTRLKAWAPLAAALLATALYVLVQESFALHRFEPSIAVADADSLGMRWQASLEAAKTHWATAIFVSTGIMLALASLAVAHIWKSKLRRVALGAALPAIAGLWLLFHQATSAVVPHFLEREMALVQAASGFDPKPCLVVFLSGLFSTAILVGASLASILQPVLQDEVDVADVLTAEAATHTMLALTTSWLIVGVVGVGLFHAMAAASVDPATVPSIEILGRASTILSGAYYSTILAATFGTSELLLRQAAARVAVGEEASDAPAQRLPSERLKVSVGKSVMRVIAVLTPLLASVLQNLVQ